MLSNELAPQDLEKVTAGKAPQLVAQGGGHTASLIAQPSVVKQNVVVGGGTRVLGARRGVRAIKVR